MVTGFKPYRTFGTFTQIAWVYSPKYKHVNASFYKGESFISLIAIAGHKVSARNNSHI